MPPALLSHLSPNNHHINPSPATLRKLKTQLPTPNSRQPRIKLLSRQHPMTNPPSSTKPLSPPLHQKKPSRGPTPSNLHRPNLTSLHPNPPPPNQLPLRSPNRRQPSLQISHSPQILIRRRTTNPPRPQKPLSHHIPSPRNHTRRTFILQLVPTPRIRVNLMAP